MLQGRGKTLTPPLMATTRNVLTTAINSSHSRSKKENALLIHESEGNFTNVSATVILRAHAQFQGYV